MLKQDFSTETSFKDMLKKYAFSGILVAILMIGLGILIFVAPVAVNIGAGVLMAIGIGIQGIQLIVRYFTSKSKSIWDLMLGIMEAFFAGWLMMLWFGDSDLLLAAIVLNCIAMLLAFILIVTGFNKIMFASSLKASGYTKTGMTTFSGWMNLILAFFFMCSPFVTTVSFEWIGGIYLIVSGIIVIVECISFLVSLKKEK